MKLYMVSVEDVVWFIAHRCDEEALEVWLKIFEEYWLHETSRFKPPHLDHYKKQARRKLEEVDKEKRLRMQVLRRDTGNPDGAWPSRITLDQAFNETAAEGPGVVLTVTF